MTGLNLRTFVMDRSALRTAIIALALLGTLSWAVWYRLPAPEAGAPAISVSSEVADIVQAQGSVELRRRGQARWESANVGALLREGDLVRTGSGASAAIRYRNGKEIRIPPHTLFSIRRADPESTPIVPAAGTSNVIASPREPLTAPAPANPLLQLQRIVVFGRSLELVGKVDPGSRLEVNGESVDVGVDGTFKHFTRPFPPGSRRVELVFEAVDLAGRVQSMITYAEMREATGSR